MYLDDIARQIADELDPDLLPDEDGVDRLLRSYAVLARAKGTAVTAEDIHDAWVAWMAESDPHHESLKPFSELDAATRHEDDPFATAVRAVAARLP
jgi:hypothetical protein